MKIALCDDDKEHLSRIYQLVTEFLKTCFSEDKIEIHSFGNGLDLLAQIERGIYYDVMLLDVMMPGLNGIELATEIRYHDEVAKIIFLTSSPDFAVDSYSVSAFHYLMKPVQKDKLFTVLKKACELKSDLLQESIIVKAQTGLTKILFHELIYLEVLGRTICYHMKNGNVLKSIGTISQLESLLLSESRFIKSHRSFIVNLDFVKNLSADGFSMTNEARIPISRKAYKEVKEKYIEHAFKL